MNDIELNGDLPELRVDEGTGEILGFETDVVVDDLPKLARGLRWRQKEIARLRDYQDKEVNRIVESVEHKIDKHEDQMEYIQNRARDMMRAAGHKDRDYPGLGKFRFGKTRAKVDGSDYDAMEDGIKQLIFDRHEEDYFNVKTVVALDKKAIKAALVAGDQIDGFCLTEPEETFTFKPED